MRYFKFSPNAQLRGMRALDARAAALTGLPLTPETATNLGLSLATSRNRGNYPNLKHSLG